MTDTTTPPEMSKPDFTWAHTDQCQGWYEDDEGTTTIERAYGELQRYAAEKAQLASSLSEELNRVRTTQAAAAHALDTLRQLYGLDLIDGEHPADTAKRIAAEKDAEVERLRESLSVIKATLNSPSISAHKLFRIQHITNAALTKETTDG